MDLDNSGRVPFIMSWLSYSKTPKTGEVGPVTVLGAAGGEQQTGDQSFTTSVTSKSSSGGLLVLPYSTVLYQTQRADHAVAIKKQSKCHGQS